MKARPPLRPHAPSGSLAVLALALAGLLAPSCGDTEGSGPGAPVGPERRDAGLVPQDGVPFVAMDNRGIEAPPRTRYGYHDFGAVPRGEVLHHRFRLRNMDDVPLTVRRVETGCACSVPRIWTIDPDTGEERHGNRESRNAILTVQPGAEAFVDVAVDTDEVRTPNIDKLIMIRLITSSQEKPYGLLECHLVVEEYFHSNPSALDLGEVAASSGGAGQVEVFPLGGGGARLVELAPLPHGMYGHLTHDTGRTHDRWVLLLGITDELEPGPFAQRVEVATELDDGTRGAPWRIDVRARIVPDVVAEPGRLVLRGSPATGSVELVARGADERWKPASVELDGIHSDGLTHEIEVLEPDDEGRGARIRVTLSAEPGAAPADPAGLIVLQLDGPRPLTVRVPYAGSVR